MLDISLLLVIIGMLIIPKIIKRKKEGVWLHLNQNLYKCSKCNQIIAMIIPNKYCPYCGERKILDIRRYNDQRRLF